MDDWDELMAEVDQKAAELLDHGVTTVGQIEVRIGGPDWDQPGTNPLGDMLAWVAEYQRREGWDRS